MSEALERVIAEQQREIDNLRKKLQNEHVNGDTLYKGREELFSHMARVLEFGVREHWDKGKESDFKRYVTLLHEVRIGMMEAGYCLRCRNFAFDCECDRED